MNKNFAVIGAMAIVLIGIAAYFWADRRASEITTPELINTHEKETNTAAPAPEPKPDASTQEVQEPSLTQEEPVAQPAPRIGNNIGMRKELSSVDFGIYLALTAVGYEGQVSGATGKYRNEQLVRAFQQEHDLTDEELQKYIEFSIKTLQADTQQQAMQQKAICTKRDEFASLHDFGNAVNEFSRTSRTHQETLARQAESELGEALYANISSRVRSRPLPELTEVDSAALFVSRNEPLSKVIERFCSYSYE